MPMIKSAVESAAGRKVDRSLSPDEAISHGAAIYAGLLLKQGASRMEGMSVRNVNSHDLGVLAIESSTGRPRRQVMIARNTPLPATHSVRFKTHKTNQSNVKIQVVEGGDDSGNDATQIGQCVVDQLPKNVEKGTKIDVEFQYEADGRLSVKASMPDIPREVRLVMTREAGLKPESFDYWKQRITEGLPDSSVVAESADATSGNEGIDSMAAEAPVAAIVEPTSDGKPVAEVDAPTATPTANALPDFSSLNTGKKKSEQPAKPSSKSKPAVAESKVEEKPKEVKPAVKDVKPEPKKSDAPAAFPDFSALRSAKKKN